MSLIDPYKYSKAVEKQICKGRDRYYAYFGCTPFIGGMSRGFTCGCNFKCVFCLSPFRDFANGETRFILSSLYKEIKRTRGFYSPEEVIERLVSNENSKKMDEIAMFDGVKPKISKYKYIDVGYAEITIGREHLLGLCKAAAKTDYKFVVETNGFLIGYESDYAQALAPYKDNILVRVGVKAGTSSMMEKLVGIKGSSVEYTFKGIENLCNVGIQPDVAIMYDPRIYPESEKEIMIKKIQESGYTGDIHVEKVYPYYTAYKRFVEAGWDPYLLATNGKLEVSGKRIKGTYMIERFDGDSLLLPDSYSKGSMLDRYFRNLLSKGDFSTYNNLNVVIEFNIEGKHGGTWRFNIDNSKVSLERGMTINPDLVYVMDLDTAIDCFVSEKLDFAQSFLSGKIKMQGDLNLHFKLVEIFDLFSIREPSVVC
jgi:uncharacterized Fe-S cluster-containing radical SAM superfamily protein/putative sterol carrier protein